MGGGRIALAAAPVTLMVLTSIATTGAEDWLVGFGRTEPQRALFARAGAALPYVLAAITGIVFLFTAAGSANIRFAGWGAFGEGWFLACSRSSTGTITLPTKTHSCLCSSR